MTLTHTPNTLSQTQPYDTPPEDEVLFAEQEAGLLMDALAMGDLPGAVYVANKLIGIPEELGDGLSHTYSLIEREAKSFVRKHISVVTERDRSGLFGRPTRDNPKPDPVAVWETATDKTSPEAVEAMRKVMLYAGRYVWGWTNGPIVLGSDLKVRTVDYRGSSDRREGILRRYIATLGYERGPVSGSPILAWCDTHPGVGDQLRDMLAPPESSKAYLKGENPYPDLAESSVSMPRDTAAAFLALGGLGHQALDNRLHSKLKTGSDKQNR